MKRCSPKHLPTCDEKVTQGENYSCEPFEFCTTQGSVSYDGRCMFFTPTSTPIPDGWYTAIEFVDGCIRAVGMADSPGYTPSDCCGSTGGGGGGSTSTSITIHPDPSNLTTQDPLGVLTRAYFQDTTTAQVTGTGTIADPFRVTVLPASGASIVATATAPIMVSGVGTSVSPLHISMATVAGLAPGQYGAFIIDSYGRVVSYDASQNYDVNINAVSPVQVSETVVPNGKIFTISVDDIPVTLTGSAGIKVTALSTPNTYQIALDTDNTVASTAQLGPYEIQLGSLGQILGVVQTTSIPPGTFYAATTSGGPTNKRVDYNSAGLITSVV